MKYTKSSPIKYQMYYVYSSQLPLQLRNSKKGSELSVIPIPIKVPKKTPSAGKNLEDSTLHAVHLKRLLPLP